MELFGRRVEVHVAGMRFEYPGIRIDFDIPFDDGDEPDIANVTLYNLGDKLANSVEKWHEVIIKAGYKDNVGTIFEGVVEDVWGSWEDVDRLIRIEVGDGSRAWQDTTVTEAYSEGITAEQILQDLAGLMDLEVGEIDLPDNVEYENGRAISGPVQQIMRDIAKDAGAQFGISGGVIQIRQPDSGDDEGVVLKADTGLIETPQRRLDEEDRDSYDVWCLLNHRIKPNSIVKVESRTARGWYRVKAGRHVCNEMDFMSYLEVVAVE